MSAGRAPRRFAPILRGIGVVAAIVALLVGGRFAGGYIPAFAAWVNGLGVWVLWNDGKENFTSQELEGYQAPQDMNVGDLNQDGSLPDRPSY